jgi:hypothetical protein
MELSHAYAGVDSECYDDRRESRPKYDQPQGCRLKRFYHDEGAKHQNDMFGVFISPTTHGERLVKGTVSTLVIYFAPQ